MTNRGGNVEISFNVDDDDENGNGNATNELEEYLLQQNQKKPVNVVSGFFSNVGSGIQKILPRKIGGTG
jgi:chorismate mutase